VCSAALISSWVRLVGMVTRFEVVAVGEGVEVVGGVVVGVAGVVGTVGAGVGAGLLLWREATINPETMPRMSSSPRNPSGTGSHHARCCEPTGTQTAFGSSSGSRGRTGAWPTQPWGGVTAVWSGGRGEIG